MTHVRSGRREVDGQSPEEVVSAVSWKRAHGRPEAVANGRGGPFARHVESENARMRETDQFSGIGPVGSWQSEMQLTVGNIFNNSAADPPRTGCKFKGGLSCRLGRLPSSLRGTSVTSIHGTRHHSNRGTRCSQCAHDISSNHHLTHYCRFTLHTCTFCTQQFSANPPHR